MRCSGHEFIVQTKSMTFANHIFFQVDKDDRAKVPQCFDIISRLFGGQNVANCNISGVLHPSLLSRRLKCRCLLMHKFVLVRSKRGFPPEAALLMLMTLFTGSVA